MGAERRMGRDWEAGKVMRVGSWGGEWVGSGWGAGWGLGDPGRAAQLTTTSQNQSETPVVLMLPPVVCVCLEALVVTVLGQLALLTQVPVCASNSLGCVCRMVGAVSPIWPPPPLQCCPVDLQVRSTSPYRGPRLHAGWALV